MGNPTDHLRSRPKNVQILGHARVNFPVGPIEEGLASAVKRRNTTATASLYSCGETKCLPEQFSAADFRLGYGGQIRAYIECSRWDSTEEGERKEIRLHEKENVEDTTWTGSAQIPTTATYPTAAPIPHPQPTPHAIHSMQPSQPGPMVNLPLWERYQAAHVTIDNLMHYLLAFYCKEGPSFSLLRNQFEAEIRPRIEQLQRTSAAAYREIFKEFFPCKTLEIELSDRRRRQAKRRVRPLVKLAEATLEGLMDWAVRSCGEDLNREDLSKNICVEGEEIWAASFRERQERVNKVIAQFTYKGKPLGYVGSMSTGFRGPHKGKTHFDPNDFDVDLYVIDEQEYERERCRNPESRFMDLDKIFPSEEETPYLMAFSKTVASALAQEFPGVQTIWESTVVLRRVPPW